MACLFGTLFRTEVSVVEHHHHGDGDKVPEQAERNRSDQNANIADLGLEKLIEDASDEIAGTEDAHNAVERTYFFVKDTLRCGALPTLAS